MRAKRLSVTAGVLAGGLAAMAPIRGGMVGTERGGEAEIARVAGAYAAAMNAGDAAAMAAVYADDGVEMPPGRPALHGRTEIEGFHRQELAGGAKISGFALTASETRVTGDVAFTAGSSRMTIAPPGAPAVEAPGKYVVVLRKTGGAWKVAYAIYNTDGPCGH